jgi:hypothetical protein
MQRVQPWAVVTTSLPESGDQSGDEIRMTIWVCAALVVVTSLLSFWAGMQVERKRNELQDGMAATLDAIDRDREDRVEGDDGGDAT